VGSCIIQIPSLKFLTQERPTLQLAELLIWPQIVPIQRLCLNLSWLKALPDSSNLIVSIKEVCAGQPVVVELSGLGALTAITINYSLSGANNIGVQMVPLMVNAGRTSYHHS
jgi:hypothetical protein